MSNSNIVRAVHWFRADGVRVLGMALELKRAHGLTAAAAREKVANAEKTLCPFWIGTQRYEPREVLEQHSALSADEVGV